MSHELAPQLIASELEFPGNLDWPYQVGAVAVRKRYVTVDFADDLVTVGIMWYVTCNHFLTHWSRAKMADIRRRQFQMPFIEWKYINFD